MIRRRSLPLAIAAAVLGVVRARPVDAQPHAFVPLAGGGSIPVQVSADGDAAFQRAANEWLGHRRMPARTDFVAAERRVMSEVVAEIRCRLPDGAATDPFGAGSHPPSRQHPVSRGGRSS